MTKSISKSVMFAMLFVLLIAQGEIFSQVNDGDAYTQAKNIKDPKSRIEAMINFLKNFPESHSALNARYNIFTTWLDLNDENKTLVAAEDIINNTSGGTQVSLLNNIAFNLAEKKFGLDKAKEYIDKAIWLASSNPKAVKMFKDTKALIMFNLGYADSALVLEQEAIVGNETNPDYLKNLSIYQFASGKKNDALINSAKAVLFGDADEPLTNFNSWLKEIKSNKNDQQTLRKSIVDELITEYLKDSNKDNQTEMNSDAAVFLARMNQDLDKAEKWAQDAVTGINNNTSIDETIKYKTNLAIVYSTLNKNNEALQELNSVKEYVDPWNGDFWTALGNIYEKSGDNDNALRAYAQGLIAFANPLVQKAVKNFLVKNNIPEESLDKMIDTEKEKMLDFEPGKNEKTNSTGKTVLAELFTGAECPPCVAADLAFDKLSEYYSRKDFIVLEYHLHIPGPDPMTNPETFKRYQYYGGNFGTPTMFFDGGGKIVGGGPDYLAANRFKVFNFEIEKAMSVKPSFKITANAEISGDNIVNVNVELNNNISKSDSNSTLHAALVEKSIIYKGANGLGKHAFVVRDLLNGPNGKAIALKNGKEKSSGIFDLNKIEKNISLYLDDPTKDPSWRGPFNGWRERTDKINPDNLAVVVWVQDNSTKEILQSFYTDVTKEKGTK